MIPITNDTNNNMKVCGRTILPGATAHFDEHVLPPHLRPDAKKEEVPPINPLMALLENPIAKVLPELQALSDGQLTELEEIEASYGKRQGIAKGVAEERLRRANLKLEQDESSQQGDEDDDSIADVLALDIISFSAACKGLSDAQLIEAAATEEAGENRADMLEVIQAEVEQRAGDEQDERDDA